MMLRRVVALGVVGSVGLVSGCAGGGERETVVVTSTQWVDPDSGAVAEPDAGETKAEGEAENAADWRTEYEWVLSHPGNYPVNAAAQYTPDGTYEYALVEATGGGTPELLLAVGGSDTTPVIVFTIGDDGKARASTDVLMMGAPGNGGGRLAVRASASGRGVYQISGSSLGKESVSELFALNGTSLSGGTKENFPSDGLLPDHQLIDWIPVSNLQPLHDGNLTVLPPSGESASRGEPQTASSHQIEFVGNVVRKTGEELMAPRGLDMPNGQDPQSEYFLLWLDQPMSVTGFVGGGTDTKEIQYVALGSRELWPRGPEEKNIEWEGRVGERIRILKNKDAIGFPSDTSMPLGALWISPEDSFEVLN
ncbi:hypothetical protein [Corynebacterium haemomassiliense]|uniref:hypothetical protein n=1 Tax=Corynebacterium haemomassiliense TaxID=2754726 RepID=UPI00288A93B2|nr:hypothetical protein [Corynebacterium haemomassiliense]